MLLNFYLLRVSAYLLLLIPEQIAVCDVPLIMCLCLDAQIESLGLLSVKRCLYLR